MRRLFNGVVRGFAVFAVVCALAAPNAEAATFNPGKGGKYSKFLKRLIAVVLGDELSDPKPAPKP